MALPVYYTYVCLLSPCCDLHHRYHILFKMSRFCSIWDLSKELQNIASGDILRPQNPLKGSRWLLQRLNQLPQELECQARVRAYRLTRLQDRAVWREMANHHLEVIEILWSATNDPRKFHCLFNFAMRKMKDFLEDFATKAAPLASQPHDPQFKILMENFGTVIETISIFYDCFDCEKRSETLKAERNAGRMHFFRFDKNDPKPPLDTLTSQRLYDARYPRAATPEDLHMVSDSFDWPYPNRSEMDCYYWPRDEM